jgi:hypothetical protein
MKNPFLCKVMLAVFVLVLAGCAPSSMDASTPEVVVQSTIPTSIPTYFPTATMPPEPTATQNSFVSTIYKDEANGFELDYPAGWTLIPNHQIGSRGATAQLFSPGTTAETLLAGGTRVSITVYEWDPKNDLASYVTHRKTAWDSSSAAIIKEAKGDLVDGRKEMHFIVGGPDKLQTYFLFTTVGEKYLEIAGDGDLALIEEIAHTLRP